MNKSIVAVKIEQDLTPTCPTQDWDMLGIYVGNRDWCHERNIWGDLTGLDIFDLSRTDAEQRLEANKDIVWFAPVYAYIHGGETISLGRFSCQWDSGQVGWAILTRQAVLDCYGGKRVTKQKLERAIKCVHGEIEAIDQYLRGDVYGYTVKYSDGTDDSCWGFYGDNLETNGMLDYIDEQAHQLAKEAMDDIGNWVFNSIKQSA